jgi:hypothetical protein
VSIQGGSQACLFVIRWHAAQQRQLNRQIDIDSPSINVTIAAPSAKRAKPLLSAGSFYGNDHST